MEGQLKIASRFAYLRQAGSIGVGKQLARDCTRFAQHPKYHLPVLKFCAFIVYLKDRNIF